MPERFSRRKLLASLTLIGLVGIAAGSATFGAFTSATAVSGNRFATGTVLISDNDLGSAMLDLSNALPGQSDTSCIKVTYSGSLDAEVHLYGTVSGALAPYLDLTVTRGSDSSAFGTCGSFVADPGGGVLYSGPLSGFPANWGSGIVDNLAGTPEVWQASEAHAYRFVVTLADNAAAQGQSADATFTWEARNL
jgi:hypothetical protein